MSTTESGWPVLPPTSPLIRTIVIPDDPHHPTHLALRWGTPALLLGHLALRFDTTVEDLNDGPVLDDWGYAYRPVRGYSTVWSDHAGGIAEDLDAVRHQLGQVGTFTPAQHAQIEKILEQYDGCIYWGGNYHNRKDEMHFGLAKPLAEAEKVSRRLLDTKRGQMMCAANPGLRAYVLS